MKKEKILAVIVFAITLLFLSVMFVVDDATGLGELIDPIEFMFMAVIGYVAKGEIEKI